MFCQTFGLLCDLQLETLSDDFVLDLKMRSLFKVSELFFFFSRIRDMRVGLLGKVGLVIDFLFGGEIWWFFKGFEFLSQGSDGFFIIFAFFQQKMVVFLQEFIFFNILSQVSPHILKSIFDSIEFLFRLLKFY